MDTCRNKQKMKVRGANHFTSSAEASDLNDENREAAHAIKDAKDAIKFAAAATVGNVVLPAEVAESSTGGGAMSAWPDTLMKCAEHAAQKTCPQSRQ